MLLMWLHQTFQKRLPRVETRQPFQEQGQVQEQEEEEYYQSIKILGHRRKSSSSSRGDSSSKDRRKKSRKHNRSGSASKSNSWSYKLHNGLQQCLIRSVLNSLSCLICFSLPPFICVNEQYEVYLSTLILSVTFVLINFN